MLISHTKQFIFTKTVKTAGTSVEAYFEPYCMAEGEWQPSHTRPSYVGETGIIGARGLNAREQYWYAHLSAFRIRQRIGAEVWGAYFKFTVVRNPFDMVVSRFFHNHRDLPVQQAQSRFRAWVPDAIPFGHRMYQIDGEVCVDYFIRFERLLDGIREVCERLRIPYQPERLPAYKSGLRPRQVGLYELYDERTRRLVADSFAWEIERFGYEFPE